MTMTTRELRDLLQRHYIKPGENLPGGVFLPEVGWNGTFIGTGGGCDAIYVGFTSSSGRLLVGHELKISRADWLRELNKPGKADGWADQCHQWWLVVNDPAVVHDGELPHGWGLMSPGKSRTRMQVHTKADTKTDHTPSWLAVRSTIARQDTLRAQAITEGRAAAYDKIRAENEPRVDAEVARRLNFQPDVEELGRKLKLIETALGGQIDWQADERGHILPGRDRIGLAELELIATAVRAAGNVRGAVQNLTAGYVNPVKRTRRAVDELARALDELAKADSL